MSAENILRIIKNILRVIYSPIKAFKSIVAKPDLKGPFIILALLLIFSAIAQYALSSRILLANRMPENEEWTELSDSPSWNWSSNGNISFDNVTYMIGNYSIKSAVSNGTSVSLNLTNIGTLKCMGDESYERLSFWINWTNHLGNSPNNATLRLFSMNENNYFELNLNDLISKTSGNWIGNWSTPALGIALSSDQGWKRVHSPSWESITGLGFTLKWSESASANLTMSIDDLYFVTKPISFLATSSFGDYIAFTLVTILINVAIIFFFTWIVYVGSFYVISSVSHQKFSSWRALFSVIGYAFAIAIIGVLFRAIIYLSLPALSFPLSSWPPSTLSDSIRAIIMIERLWYSNIVYRLTFLASPNPGLDEWIVDVWIVALCAISVRELGGFSWRKAVTFAAFAYFIKFFLFGVWRMV